RRAGDLPVLVHVVSQRARVLRLRRTEQSTRDLRGCCVAFLHSERSRRPVPLAFRSSIARPTDTSVYASNGTSRCHLQDSRPGWIRCAPFLWGSFIPYNMPVYPGALRFADNPLGKLQGQFNESASMSSLTCSSLTAAILATTGKVGRTVSFEVLHEYSLKLPNNLLSCAKMPAAKESDSDR